MDEIRLGRIEDKLDKIIDTQFTKSDMSNFMDNICSPSRGKQDSMEERLQKTEKLQARHGGMIAAVVSYSIPVNANTYGTDLLDVVYFNDVIYTNGKNIPGWVVKISVNTAKDQYDLSVMLQLPSLAGNVNATEAVSAVDHTNRS